MIDPKDISTTLKKAGQLQKTFKIIGKRDYGSSVMHILKLMQDHKILPDIERETKCKYKSHFLRDQGNVHFKNNEYDLALQHYNLALLFAPKGSKAMKLGLGNRSALYFKLNRYKACEKDIEAALKMGFPPELKPKLLARLHACRNSQVEHLKVNPEVKRTCLSLLQVKDCKNKSIPCATSSIDVKMNDEKRVVVASKDIEVGDVIAVENPFVSHISKENQTFCCHGCHKFTENLIPCDTCCVAMYCDENCRERSWRQGHHVECDLMSVYAVLPNLFRVSLKAVLKARNDCSSWEELMEKVRKANTVDKAQLGFVQNESNILELDSKYYESICTQAPFRDVINIGHMFDMAVFSAIGVHAISLVFMEDVTDKQEVMKFVGNQLMFHTVAGIAKHISAPISSKYDVQLPDMNLTLPNKAIGYFAFAGMLPHSCNPNVECFGLNNKLVLVATKSIPAGTELVTCYGMTYLEGTKQQREYVLQKNFRIKCNCEACDRNWKTETFPTYNITKAQDEFIIKFCLGRVFAVTTLEKAAENFSTLCTGLATLQDKPKSQYILTVYKAFKHCLSHFQYHLAPHYLRGTILSIEHTLKLITFSKKK